VYRNGKTHFSRHPPPADKTVRGVALPTMRKVSGSRRPSAARHAASGRAVVPAAGVHTRAVLQSDA
jgi:hypothetical protein